MEYTIEDWFAKGELTIIGGYRIFHLTEGTGPHLLLLHGFPTSSWDWQRVWHQLCTQYTVSAFDMLGFGYSDKPQSHRYTIHQQATIAQELLLLKGIRSFHVMAHDYGDTVAQELLARQLEHPIGMRSCTLLNGGLFPETHRPRLVQRLLASPAGYIISSLLSYRRFSRSFKAVFGADTQPNEAELGSFWRLITLQGGQRIYHKLIRYMAERRDYRSRWVGALQQTTVPLALINGLADPVSGRHMVERYRELISDRYIFELEGIGHYPQTESPYHVLESLRLFHQSVL